MYIYIFFSFLPSLYFPVLPESMEFKGKSHYISQLKLLGWEIAIGHTAVGNIRSITPNGGSHHNPVYLSKDQPSCGQSGDYSQASAINRILRKIEIRVHTQIFFNSQ